jgi:hypothetical protein
MAMTQDSSQTKPVELIQSFWPGEFGRRLRAKGEKMKKEILKGTTMVTIVIVLALATAVASANAQTANKVAANIPFEFSVGYKTMPAGEYLVRSLSSGAEALMIQSADAKVCALRHTEETAQLKSHTNARLVFHRYGDQYFLAEVWNGVDGTGRQLMKSQEESALEQELAKITSTGEIAKNTFEIVEVVAVNR